MKINIITLGCSKNTVDSENLAGRLSAAGHKVFFERQRNDCDTVIINTCGFIGDAKEESINTILQQIAVKTRKHSAQRLIVCGCLVQRYREELKTELPEVDEWYGVHEWNKIIENCADKNSHARIISTPKHYAYLKIAEGCNRTCSYCAIPLIRGAHKSRPLEDIVSEAKSLVVSGVKEIIVISQDTTYYGLDLYHRRALGELLERLATESGAPWIRLHYTYPSSFPSTPSMSSAVTTTSATISTFPCSISTPVFSTPCNVALTAKAPCVSWSTSAMSYPTSPFAPL